MPSIAKSVRRDTNFQIGDSVRLSLKNYKPDHSDKKLNSQMAGPFLMVKWIEHSYCLDLLSNMQIHNDFSSDKLQLAANDSLPDQMV